MSIPRYLTPMLKRRLVIIDRAVRDGLSRSACEDRLAINANTMASTMFRLFGETTWPPVIDARLWTLPIEDPSPPSNGGRKRPQPDKDGDAIAERVRRDQERIRAKRERWLDIEQEKYGLPKRGRSIDDMPA